MTVKTIAPLQQRWLLPCVAIAGFALGFALSCLPAAAQTYYWSDRPSRYSQPAPSRDFFSFPFFGGGVRPPPVADYSRAPPPRKLATPPTSTVTVIGDLMADWLGYGLDEIYADQPDVGVTREVRATAGLIRYDAKNEALDWPQVVKDALANDRPNAIIIMLGLNDRIPIRDGPPPHSGPEQKGAAADKDAEQAAKTAAEKAAVPSDSEAAPEAIAAGTTQRPVPGGVYEFHSDQWADLYVKRIDDMIAAAKSKGVPVVWVGLPALRGTKSTSEMAYLDELYRERAERAGIAYVDIWDGFVDDQGRYAVEGPDFEGQIRRLRTADGVHFTKSGAVKLASYVDQELRRVMSNRAVPVALPMGTSPVKPGTLRPDIGPVLPLTASDDAGAAGGLIGAGSQPVPAAADPLAAKLLTRGDPIAAVAGRADDFAWPRPAADASGTTANAAPEPATLAPAAPAAPAKKDVAADGKKPSDAKKDVRNKPTAELSGGRGAPRPPKDIGGGF